MNVSLSYNPLPDGLPRETQFRVFAPDRPRELPVMGIYMDGFEARVTLQARTLPEALAFVRGAISYYAAFQSWLDCLHAEALARNAAREESEADCNDA